MSDNDPKFGGNDWGVLPQEPCRYCRKQGGIEFLVSNQPMDLFVQTVRCKFCGNIWEADTPNA